MGTMLIPIALLFSSLMLIAVGLWGWVQKRRFQRFAETSQNEANRFKTIFDSANDAILLYDPETDRIIHSNPALGDLFGYPFEDIHQLNLKPLFSGKPPYSLKELQALNAAALKGVPQVFEWWTADRAGKRFWIEISLKRAMVLDRPHLLFFIRDISGRKKTEERLYRLIHIVDQVGEGVVTTSLDGVVTYVNLSWAQMHGYLPQALIGKHYSIFHTEAQYRDEVLPFNKKVLRTGYHKGEVGHMRSNGSLFPTHMTVTLQRDESGHAIGYIAIAMDLSEQKRVEEALRESEIRFRHLFSLSPQPISLTDLDGRIIDVNEKFCELLQCPRHDVISKYTIDLGFPVEERQRFIEELTEKGEVSGFEVRVKNATGASIDLQMFARLIRIKGDFLTLTVFHDVTVQRMLEAQLMQAQKMEAIGTLAGGIAHDFNNILSAILGYIELTRISVDPDSRVAQYIEEVFKAVNRAIDLVRQILSISRQSEQERKPIRVENVIRDVVKLLRATLPASILIKEQINENIGLTRGDPGQIHQVLMNLGTNAGQAMKGKGGTLTIRLDRETIGSDAATDAIPLGPGAYLKLTVSDTGCGIAPKDRKRIFDPYYTTKEKGMGTGLGLAVAQGIVQKHGGIITFSSEVGVGTDFHVYLPMILPAPKKEFHEKLKTNQILPHGKESILLVDDEKPSIDTGREMLEYLGYRVQTCMTGMEALTLFKETPDGFDLIISDMTMPGMSGDQLSESLIRIRPDIPIILCTGFNPQIDEASAREIGIKAFIFKPLTLQKLALLVRKVLDEQGRAGV